MPPFHLLVFALLPSMAATATTEKPAGIDATLTPTTGKCLDPNNDPCICNNCGGSMGSAGCASANGGCCYYYSMGYLNTKDGAPGNEKWMCTSWHPATRKITVNAGGPKIKDQKTGLYSYNPERVCKTGAGEKSYGKAGVVHLPFTCEEGAQSPCDECALDSLKRISEPRSAYVTVGQDIHLPGECAVCRKGYTLHPQTKGCCPDDGTWDLGERDNTCSAVRRSRGMGMPADGGYCECRGCAAAPAGQGKKGCGSLNGGCCWYSEDNGGTCTDTKLPGMTAPQKVCHVLRGDAQQPRPSSQWSCTAGVNEPCMECGGYSWNASKGPRQCTRCNEGYELIEELGSCCRTDSWGMMHVLLFLVIFIGIGGLGFVGIQKYSSGAGSGSQSTNGYSARGLAGRAGDFGL